MLRMIVFCLTASGLVALARADSDLAQRERSEQMVKRVNERIQVRWQEEQVEPSAQASDSEFLRRVYLDLVGVVPRVAEARDFLTDQSPDKRRKLIERLLASPRYATHMANSWRQVMLPGGIDLGQIQNVAGVQNWLREQFAENMRYDRIVSDFLTSTGGGDAGPALFYTSLELKPEKLAASTARIFLGLQIECAECHSHPFDKWTQQDFWGYAAFFAQLRQNDMANNQRLQVALLDLDEGDVTLPDTEEVVLPKFPGGVAPHEREAGTSRRLQLAIWMESRENPFLARAAVNRVWAHLFGRGLVEPVDDIGEHNPASHPELFQELTEYFIETGFDLRELVWMLANTRAYQLSSRTASEGDPPAEDLFARAAIKTLTAEQLYDCLERVLMRTAPTAGFFPGAPVGLNPQKLSFVGKMRMRGASATEFEAGVLQALTLLNGSEVQALTSVENSGLLMALEAPWISDEQRVEALFLATLTRRPTDDERQTFLAYVRSGGPREDKRQAISDALWALLNSAEFTLNH